MLMRNRLLGVILTSTLLVSGCVTLSMTRQDYESIKPPMHVAWQKTPVLRAPTWASVVLITLGGVVTAPVGAYMEMQSTKKLKGEIVIPDIGFEVASRYMHIWRKKGNPPEMVLAKYPIESDHEFPGASIDFSFTHYFIGADGGLVANCQIIIKDNYGKTIHKNVKMYTPYALNRKKLSRDEFMEDNGKILVEEIKIAAQYIADEFVKDILVEISK